MASSGTKQHMQEVIPIQEFSKAPDLKGIPNSPDESKYFSIKVCKNRQISICKPLLPLKLTLFVYYGAGSFMTAFLTIIYKQRGISLSELSTMTIAAPAFQFMGTTLSGVMADKLGRAKPVLVVNLLLYLCTLIAIITMPKISNSSVEAQNINLTCHPGDIIRAETTCMEFSNSIEVKSCSGYCSELFAEECSDKYHECQSLDKNTSLSIYVNESSLQSSGGVCQYYISAILYGNSTYTWCTGNQNTHCMMSCVLQSGRKSPEVTTKFSWLFIGYISFYILFLTTYSNCYRCLDVTCMFLVREHDSDFGHERFFAMLGNVLISPIAGYVADLATSAGGERNYTAALYLAIGMNVFLLFVIYKLPVRINAPGEKMLKKSFILLKNPDAVVFLVVILVLGTAWNFGKFFMFWFLEEMNASTVLVGLITSVSALYGLPFLLTADWWVKHLGPTRIFTLALLAYVVNASGYSFLYNPWYSLVLEGTAILSYYLLWVAVMEYSHDIAPDGLRATVIATSGAIHFSIGKTMSGLLGRFIMNPFGGRITFRIIAITCLIITVFYVLYQFIRQSCWKKKYDLELKERSMKG